MLKDLNEAGKKILLLINSIWGNDENIRLDGYLITETSTYVYLGRSLNMENNLKEEDDRRRKAA
ncbi:hypothetical protein KIN20_005364 [Parelaphostrongylus tenuis]|uniref:Uncharacterized protein n=1 Tax=Parelaphostrongylus tenuis TaxID=148309 RepID=A0AAD5M215_PARTN|nr:hypothetical protein KIN20_005364 [Parelaphostrongylus tenuis]